MSDVIRILAVCHEDPACILGGMGRHLHGLYAAMAGIPGVQIDLLTSGPGEGSAPYCGYTKHQSDKLVCYKPKQADLGSMLMLDIQLAKTLTRLLAEGNGWDLVHAHEWGAVQVARMARDALGIPLVGTMHLCITALMQEAGQLRDLGEGDLYLMQQEGHLVVDSDEFIVCSRAYEQMVRQVFMTRRPIHVIHNGVSPGKWRRSELLAEQARGRHNFYGRPVALFVGRIADMKGIRQILDAVEQEDTGYHIVLAGEVNANTEQDKERWDVTRRIRQLAARWPERLQWLGFQSDLQLRMLYSAAQVGLMPSLHEPFGIVALECMAAGVPLICTEAGGLKEVVMDDQGEEHALIVEAGDPRQINAALRLLRDDGAARENLQKLGLQRAAGFSWEKAAHQTLSVYRQLIRRARHDRFDNGHPGQKSHAHQGPGRSL